MELGKGDVRDCFHFVYFCDRMKEDQVWKQTQARTREQSTRSWSWYVHTGCDTPLSHQRINVDFTTGCNWGKDIRNGASSPINHDLQFTLQQHWSLKCPIGFFTSMPFIMIFLLSGMSLPNLLHLNTRFISLRLSWD